jgi:hypothetical protein
VSALTEYQNGSTFPATSTTMLAAIAAELNPTDTSEVGGPPPSPHVLEAIVDAVVALDTKVNG